jgi:3-deoxy-manno-octulosonate cytidylyltransferase (CMP-KDO synthetase)
MKIIGVIPSRLESNRLNRKPLMLVDGLPLILHVYRRAKLAEILDDLIVATDSNEIASLVEADGGKAMLTGKHHKNGTERMGEVMDHHPADLYVLINGDEVLLQPNSIAISIKTLQETNADASMLAVRYHRENSPSDFKIVLNSSNHVMYISRNDIPSSARNPVSYRLKAYHLMTFRPAILRAYCNMDKTPIEKIEDHEHLRLIENGFTIAASVVNDQCISLDTEEDLPLILDYLRTDPTYAAIKL